MPGTEDQFMNLLVMRTLRVILSIDPLQHFRALTDSYYNKQLHIVKAGKLAAHNQKLPSSNRASVRGNVAQALFRY